jgi:hypothetical protein
MCGQDYLARKVKHAEKMQESFGSALLSNRGAAEEKRGGREEEKQGEKKRENRRLQSNCTSPFHCLILTLFLHSSLVGTFGPLSQALLGVSF